MKLPFLDFFKKKPTVNYFLAFLLRTSEFRAIVFEEVNRRIKVVGQGKTTLPVSVEDIPMEKMLDLADKTISMAEDNLPENIETHKTVFGVKENWVEETRIKPNYLSTLKKVSQELDLQPIGFLVFPEAIAHLLAEEEGAPVSGILVDAGEKLVSITIIRAGRIIQSKEVELEGSLAETVDNALKHFTDIEVFPSRIILFDPHKKDIAEEFINHSWSKQLPFLHIPQVSTLKSDFDTRAILFGTATQMGFDGYEMVDEQVQKPQQLHSMEEPNYETTQEVTTIDEMTPPTDESTETSEENQTEEEDQPIEEDATLFGFVKDKDVAKQEMPRPKVDEDNFTNADFENVNEEIPQDIKNEETNFNKPTGTFAVNATGIRVGMEKVFGNIKKSLPKNFKINTGSIPLGKGNKVIIFAPVAVVLVIAAFIWYIFGLHANVIIFVNPKTITQNQDVTFSTTSPTDVGSSIVAAEKVSAQEDGTLTGNATGSKDVGTPAKGSVTVFNNSDSSQTFPAGTTITSSNGLKFTFDSPVTIASASGDIFTGTTPGTATVNVTAADIGTDYNLPSQTKFTIDNSSSAAAKNDNAFSGGNKKTITVVSKDDQSKLIASLTKNLEQKAKDDMSKSAQGKKIIPLFTTEDIMKKSFDKNVGDEASSLTLTATISYESLSYANSDVLGFAQKALQNKLPDNMTLATSGITADASNLKSVDDTSVKGTLNLKASLLPKIDSSQIAKQLEGKSFTDATTILSHVDEYQDSKISLSQNLFFLPHLLPRMSGNIAIAIVENE